MVDQNQLRILRNGVETWNAWRRQAEDVRVDLRGADFHEADLIGVDLHGADLKTAVLCDVTLREASLIGADLSMGDLRGADLHEANLRGADLGLTDLRLAIFYETMILDVELSILSSRENPKICGIDDAEVVGDLVAVDMPVPRHLLAQKS